MDIGKDARVARPGWGVCWFIFDHNLHASRGLNVVITIPAQVAVAMEGAPFIEVWSPTAEYAQDVDGALQEEAMLVVFFNGHVATKRPFALFVPQCGDPAPSIDPIFDLPKFILSAVTIY